MATFEAALVGRSLRACLTGDAGLAERLLAEHPETHRSFAWAAQHHRVSGYAWRAVGPTGVLAAEQHDELRDATALAVAHHLRALSDLAAVGRALDRAAVDWLVFKGPVLAEQLHRDPGRRDYGDLDVLVRPRHLGRALEALEAVGGAVLDRNWVLLLQELRGEVHVRAPHGTVVDLHWDLVNQPRTRRSFRIDADELLERRVDVQLGDATVPTLDPEDTLLHLALHTMLSGADRLVWYKDLALAAEPGQVRWDRVRERAHRARTALVLASALQQTRRTLGGAVPPDVVGGAAARVWVGLSRRAFRFPPPEEATGRGSVARLAARATRGTLSASIVELARRTAGSAQPSRRPGPLDGSHPGSMHFPSGGSAAREAYVAAVASASGAAERASAPTGRRRRTSRHFVNS